MIRRSLNADPDALPQCVGDDDFETTPVTVSVPAHLSHTAERRDKVVHVDGCIADLVARLYPLTVSSCCGHGHDAGRIFLADGRLLVIHRPPIPDDALPHTPWGAGQHQASAMRSVRRTHQPHRLHLTNPKDGLWSKAGRLLGRFGTDRHTGGTFESVRRAWRRGNKRRRS